ncbi:MAG: SDR family oxidoreductase [Sphingomonadales bacterium]|nr:SDR family oxidoreductase [Sphingomonadales bacterium]
MTDLAEANALQRIYSLEGKVALVTGGGSGIGLAIARCLRLAGARVIIAGRRVDVLESAAAELGPDVAWAELDLSDVGSLAAFEADLTARHGPIDILINNAGNTLKKPFEDSTMADFDAVFDVHVRGALELSRRFIARLGEGRPASIIFTSSMTAFIGQPLVMGYTVAKTAISGVVRGLSAEFAARGVRVNAVAPGWIDTDLYRKATAGDIPRQQKIMSRIPMGTLGQPDDIGWACAFLASPAAAYITGQVLLVDGGGATGF